MRVSGEQVERAQQLYTFTALNNSIMGGGSDLYGAIGEIVFADHYPEWTKEESYNHDFRSPTGRTVDVKAKLTTVTPRSHYNASVAVHSRHQTPDYLFFVRVLDDHSTAWLLGWIPRDEFYQQATFNRKDEVDPTSPHGWKFQEDCWNLPIHHLRPVTRHVARVTPCKNPAETENPQ